jgi:hypothetical protein
MNAGTNVLGTSLVRARLGTVATTPPLERRLLERLQRTATDMGCCSNAFVTAAYVGWKARYHLCSAGAGRERAFALFDALATTVVGADSGQILRLYNPCNRADRTVLSGQYAALRLSTFISTLLDPCEHGKAWFVLVDVPGAATPTLHWLDHEVAATLRANGWTGARPPRNLFVLVASDRHEELPPHWLGLHTPRWSDVPLTRGADVPPVGYQRHLLASRLSARQYRRWLIQNRSWLRHAALPLWAGRWLAASEDEYGLGLWHAHDRMLNAQRALQARIETTP